MRIKKLFIITIVLILAVGFYLYLANAYTYYFFKQVSLENPMVKNPYIFNGETAGDSLIYAALGDSLTSGMGLNKYEEAFPYLLAEDLAAGSKVILQNFSYSGYRTDDLIENLLEPAIAANPDIVTLLIGTNDVYGLYSSGKFKKNYQIILERLAKNTKAKIYAISLPYIGMQAYLPPNSYYFQNKTVEFNKTIKELAAAYEVGYIDIAETTRSQFAKDDLYYAADRFHPSAAGHELWEKIIFENITTER